MRVCIDHADLVRRFEACDIDPAAFRHAEHIHVAFGLLKKYDFLEAATIYANGIRALAAKAGAPRKFNLTITCAFMSLIAERMAAKAYDDPEIFAGDNPDLMSKDALAGLYAPERLHSDIARQVFLMPTPHNGRAAQAV